MNKNNENLTSPEIFFTRTMFVFDKLFEDIGSQVFKHILQAGLTYSDCRSIPLSVNQVECLEGLHVVDLGCGCGSDSFFMSKLVGQNGTVLGLDLSADRVTIVH